MTRFTFFIFTLLIAGSLFGYDETVNLTLDIDQIEELRIEAAAGDLEVQGVDDLNQIEVRAVIIIEDAGVKQRQKILNEDLVLDLRELNSKTAVLISEYNPSLSGLLGRSAGVRVDLQVRVPKRFTMEISDGSGDIRVRDMLAWIRLNDGSGSLNITNISGDLFLDDGSGDIRLENIVGNIELDDSSGDVEAEEIAGNMRIDDSSGNLELVRVSGDIYIDDSSGDIEIETVTGNVRIRDSSGDIDVTDAESDVIIEDDGSGDVEVENVRGNFQNKSD